MYESVGCMYVYVFVRVCCDEYVEVGCVYDVVCIIMGKQ